MQRELFDLNKYMNCAIESIVPDIYKSTLKNPKETVFISKYMNSNKRNSIKRDAYFMKGQHIPVFLIASITSSCNMHCKGCYARANGMCNDAKTDEPLSSGEWLNIFEQANELGVSFVLLAGGEPLLRKDVVYAAAGVKDIIFPIFTNGSLIEEYLSFFDLNRNLVPVLSIEGGRGQTDERRGEGTYDNLMKTMKSMKKHKLLFGASITVTTENLLSITSEEFISNLHSHGCRLVFFIEYVPVEPDTNHLALTETERMKLENQLETLRQKYASIIFLSFPGDEKDMGGCLAAGRGFFHINPNGRAEACPFSPYSDRSLKTNTLLEALQSPFFKRLQAENLVGGEHNGGCALFEKEELVRQLLK